MKHFYIYRLTDGAIEVVGITADAPHTEEGQGFAYSTSKVNADTHYHDIESNQLTEYLEPPIQNARLAKWHEIKAMRNYLEQEPVSTSFGLIDADENSRTRIKDAIEDFDSLPSVEDGLLTWTMGDNTEVQLSKSDLQVLLPEVSRNRAIRADKLHRKAKEFKLNPPTIDDISKPEIWGV